MKELYVFLTHHFEEPFLSFIKKIPPENCIILFDEEKELKNVSIKIPIIKIKRIPTSYDMFGHSMYIHFFRNNKQLIEKYDYVWIIENDVYVPFNIQGKTFMELHQQFDYDLMVPEYGVRDSKWCWLRSLRGFSKIQQIGVTAVIFRMSKKFLKELIKIDMKYSGYLEAVLPHICLENNLSLQCFLPEYIGKVTTDRDNILVRQVMENPDLREEKLYHPFKKHTVS
jgi:hypothetical protein